MMTVVAIIVMAAALVGMIYCAKKQKENPNAQKYAIICLVAVLIAAVFILSNSFSGSSSEINRIIKKEAAYSNARSTIVGRYLNSKYAGQSAVIVVDSNTKKNKAMMAPNDTLTAELKDLKLKDYEVIEMPGENIDPQQMKPLEEYTNAEAYNKIFSKNFDANLIIITTSLPYNPEEIEKLTVWKNDPTKQKVVLIGSDVSMLRKAIAAGYIAAAVIPKALDNYDADKAAPSDPQAAFDERYILVTPENVKDHAKLFRDN